MYSEKVLKHFKTPYNIGELKNPDGIGTVGNMACGDIMTVYIKVEEGRIKDIKAKTFGCIAAISSASITTEIAKGKSLEEAKKITREDIAKELGGLPPVKLHCSVLAADALRKAIEDYESKRGAKNGGKRKDN